MGKRVPGYFTVVSVNRRRHVSAERRMTCCHLCYSQLESVSTAELSLLDFQKKEIVYSVVTVPAAAQRRGVRASIYLIHWKTTLNTFRCWLRACASRTQTHVALNWQMEDKHRWWITSTFCAARWSNVEKTKGRPLSFPPIYDPLVLLSHVSAQKVDLWRKSSIGHQACLM